MRVCEITIDLTLLINCRCTNDRNSFVIVGPKNDVLNLISFGAIPVECDKGYISISPLRSRTLEVMADKDQDAYPCFLLPQQSGI